MMTSPSFWPGYLTQYQRNLLWGQRYSWQHSKMHGSDILTGALVGLSSGLQASFGIATNVTNTCYNSGQSPTLCVFITSECLPQ